MMHNFTKLLAALMLLSLPIAGCNAPTRIEKQVKYKIIGKDIASDRFGNQSHYIYTQNERYDVSGVEYYALTDSIEVTEVEYIPNN